MASTKIGDLFPSKYLRSQDLPENDDVVLTIRELTQETVGQGENQAEKAILYFNTDELEQSLGEAHKDQGIVLNKTNATTIAKLYGDNYAEWPGCRVALGVEEVNFQGKMTPAIRVRNRKFPKGKAQPKAAKQEKFNMEDDGYGIIPTKAPVSATPEDVKAVAVLAEKAAALSAVGAETQTIRELLKSVKDQMILRKILFNAEYQPSTVGDAVRWLRTMIEACLENDKAAASENAPF